MRKSKQKEIIDYLEGRIHLEGEGLEKERQEFEALQKILKKEEDFQPPPGFWSSYLHHLRRRMEGERISRLRFVPVLASALSLLIIAFLLFHSQIFPPNLPPSNLKRPYGDRELSRISSAIDLERFSTSLAQAFGLNDLEERVAELMVRGVNLGGLEEGGREKLLGVLVSQLGDEADLALDLLYSDLDIDEVTGELSVDELMELKNQLKGT